MDNYPVLLIDDPQLMRGFNYRATQGITLILCKGFKNKRDTVQAKGRVGRYRDPCTRYQTVSDLVDGTLGVNYLASLYKHLSSKNK